MSRKDERQQEEYLASLHDDSHHALLHAMSDMEFNDGQGGGKELCTEVEATLGQEKGSAGGVNSQFPVHLPVSNASPNPLSPSRLLRAVTTGRSPSGHISQPPYAIGAGETPKSLSSIRPQPSASLAAYSFHITLVAGRDLPRKDLNINSDGAVIDPYCCISLIETTDNMPVSTEEVKKLNHDICFANVNKKTGVTSKNSQEPPKKALSQIRALWKSMVVQKNAFPVWNERTVFNQAFVVADLREPIDLRRPAVPKARVKGQDMLLLLTGTMCLSESMQLCMYTHTY